MAQDFPHCVENRCFPTPVQSVLTAPGKPANMYATHPVGWGTCTKSPPSCAPEDDHLEAGTRAVHGAPLADVTRRRQREGLTRVIPDSLADARTRTPARRDGS